VTTVPEVTVTENNNPGPREDDIGATGQVFAVSLEPKAKLLQSTLEVNLGLRVTSSIGLLGSRG
jgi:hypothetical protein